MLYLEKFSKRNYPIGENRMPGLSPFNSLPPKPEYINKVLAMLEKHPDSRLMDIERKTRLTKTQVMCTIKELLKEKKIETINGNSRRYRLIEKSK